MVEAARHLCVFLSASLLTQGLQEPVAQDHVEKALENLQGGRLHNCFGQLVACLAALTVKSVP